ncbi:DNA/RNA helicase domain-containing protein [Stenotrophomonas rhizophila]
MIIYQADKDAFLRHCNDEEIEEVILASYKAATNGDVGESEIRSWRESLRYVARALNHSSIPGDIGVAVEFVLPQSKKRIDVVLTGHDEHGSPHVIIVELKQWTAIKPSKRDAMIELREGHLRVHPSYQAWSYAAFLEGFNEAVYNGELQLHPCAYLHNYARDSVIESPHYQPYIQRAPLFLKGTADLEGLRRFIGQYTSKGNGIPVLAELESGRIRPSKALADEVHRLLSGNNAFALLDEQKHVFEAVKAACAQAHADRKPRVVIVEGGPGTGKSVVAVNLLATLRDGLNVKYISKNAAPRAVYSDTLIKSKENARLRHLFGGSGAFIDSPENDFDALIVDEAHRLTEQGGFYGNEGKNQIMELINAALCSVFFIDEDQRVTLKDIGTKEAIRDLAIARGATVEEYVLSSQFRCAGSDGYLAWLDDVLQIRPTANTTLDEISYDFQVFDDPFTLHAAIEAKNAGNRARVVAGYCWPWNSKKNSNEMDIVIGNYRRQWNLDQDGSLWIISPSSIDQVGCIHTCQGLEVDYIGVIIGPDLVMEGGALKTVPRARDRRDKTMKGFVKLSKSHPAHAAELADTIIKNTYRTLMTRGMKGCYVYATDPQVAAYFRARLQHAAAVEQFVEVEV